LGGGTGLGGSIGLGGTGNLGGGLGGTSNLGLGTSGNMSFGNTGSFSGTLSSSGLGFTGISSTGFSGGSYRAGGGYGGNSAANVATSAARFAGVASSNPFGSYYSNPLAAGVSSTGTAARSFGSPLYTIANTSSQLTGGVGSASIMTGSLSNSGGYSSSSMYRPTYSVSDAPAIYRPTPIIVTPLQPRADLQQVLTRSSALSSKDSLQVMSNGRIIVLRGTVVSEHDRQVAEGLVRLSPGVSDVLNEITVQPGAEGSSGSP
jgi:hypothetical protein